MGHYLIRLVITLIYYVISNLKVKKLVLQNSNRNTETEDTALIDLNMKIIFGKFICNYVYYPKNLEGSLIIFGEKGTVKIAGIAMNKIETWEFDDDDDDDDAIESTNYEVDQYMDLVTFIFMKLLVSLTIKLKFI